MERTEGGARFDARVARNALGHRRTRAAPRAAIARPTPTGCAGLGFAGDAALAAAIRAGDFDDGWEPVAAALAASARDQLLVANPSYLPEASV